MAENKWVTGVISAYLKGPHNSSYTVYISGCPASTCIFKLFFAWLVEMIHYYWMIFNLNWFAKHPLDSMSIHRSGIQN